MKSVYLVYQEILTQGRKATLAQTKDLPVPVPCLYWYQCPSRESAGSKQEHRRLLRAPGMRLHPRASNCSQALASLWQDFSPAGLSTPFL